MPSPNQRVGEYVLQERIAAGTFGEVWRGHHHVWIDQIVAVKIPTDSQYLRNLQREGVAIHGLTHPNIVRAIGFDPFADPAYLVMEYIPGTSLRQLIQNKSLSIEDSVAVLRQVLAGLGHAHQQNLIHRDVKPENILIHERAFREGFGAEGVVKVTDFGLGKAATNTAGSIAYSQALDSPEAREIAGTLDYMAPEQRSGAGVDARADLYSCGVILYELLTGERPAGTDVPSDLNRSVPRQLDEAFRRSYSRLDKRFASTDDFARALVMGPPPVPQDRRGSHGVPPPVTGFQADYRATSRYVPVRPGSQAPPPLRQGTAAPHIAGMQGCPQCRQPVEAMDQFCMHCGVQLVENVRRCPQCGAYPDGTDQYCIFCGQVLSSDVQRV